MAHPQPHRFERSDLAGMESNHLSSVSAAAARAADTVAPCYQPLIRGKVAKLSSNTPSKSKIVGTTRILLLTKIMTNHDEATNYLYTFKNLSTSNFRKCSV